MYADSKWGAKETYHLVHQHHRRQYIKEIIPGLAAYRALLVRRIMGGYTAAVLTVSDRCSAGTAVDTERAVRGGHAPRGGL